MNLRHANVLSLFFVISLWACKEKPSPKPVDPWPTPTTVPQMVPNSNGLVDQSPADILYYPLDYPILKMSSQTNESPIMRVIYSRPQKKGRAIFGHLQKYGQPWRLGANEATEIEFFRNVTIQNKTINAGRYVIYCIPEPTEWQIILNTHLFSWGLHFDSTRDVQHFKIPVETIRNPVEFFTMSFQPRDKGAQLVMAWDTVMARLPIGF